MKHRKLSQVELVHYLPHPCERMANDSIASMKESAQLRLFEDDNTFAAGVLSLIEHIQAITKENTYLRAGLDMVVIKAIANGGQSKAWIDICQFVESVQKGTWDDQP